MSTCAKVSATGQPCWWEEGHLDTLNGAHFSNGTYWREDATAPEPDEWCREGSCSYRQWRNGTTTAHRRGSECPEPTEES